MSPPRRYVPVLCLLLVTVIAGCPSNRKVSNNSAKSGSSEVSAEELLKSAIQQLRPESYTIASTTDQPINLLNTWQTLAVDPNPNAPTIPAGWINETELARLNAANFDIRDAFHVRDAMLNHVIANYLTQRASDEVGQAQAIFNFVVRNVTLRGDDEPLPLGIYELLLLGRGTALDRAWVCSALLRQVRVDCVIIRPTGDSAADPEAWLLGVLLKGQVYLFDPRLGVAIPTSADPAQTTGPPATLSEIVSHPEWLQSLAVRADQPYLIDADGLKAPEILPIAEPTFWNPRMRHLESVLPASDLCVLYEPLADEPGRIGLLSRLQAGTGWKQEQFKIWPHPQLQMEASKAPSPSVQQTFHIETQTFGLPIPIIFDEKEQKPVLGNPERKVLRIRTDQLLGKFDDATQRYVSIRHLEIESAPSQELLMLNRMGAENAMYWTGVCKFEMQDYGAAVEQLSGYVKRFDRNGRWIFAARALLAEAHAELGHFKEAADFLERNRSDDPYRAANAIRVKRWRAKK